MYNVDYKSSRLSAFFEWLFVMIGFTIIAILLSSLWLQPGARQDIQVTLTSVSLENPVVVSESGYLSSPQRKLEILDGMLLDQLAPDFSLPKLDGSEVTLSQFQGQPVLLNFWASWCVPCREEMPVLVSAYERYKNQGLVILGMNLTEQDTLPEVQSFVDEFEISYPVVLDEPGHVTNDSYGLLGLPMTVFVNREGIVKRVVIGAMKKTDIDQYITEILEEK